MKFVLRVLNCDIAVRCGDVSSNTLLRHCFSAFLMPAQTESQPALTYDISPARHAGGWMLSCGETTIGCPDDYDLIYEFEKDMTERLQLLRSDLFFVHGAALSQADRCVVIPGPSGSGKSSLAWCLSQSGFEYLSDELAPIDPEVLEVEPYPHALCLKSVPPSAPALPDSTHDTGATRHISACELRTRPPDQPCPLRLLVFLEGVSSGRDLLVSGIGNAESAARLYANGLNQLAHRGDGLPIASEMAANVPSYRISGGTVEDRARAIRGLFDSTSVKRAMR